MLNESKYFWIKNSISLSALVQFIVLLGLISQIALLHKEILFWEKLRKAGVIDLYLDISVL